MPWIVGTPCILGMLVTAIAYYDVLNSPTGMAILTLTAIILFAGIWHLSSKWEDALQESVLMVQESYHELTTLHEQLAEYLLRLNDRATRHFNSVTTTKVSAYFTLTQIKNALGERLALASHLVESDANMAVRAAHRCLQQPLQFNESVLSSSSAKSVPIDKVEKLVMELIDQMETALAALESSVETSFRPDEFSRLT